MSLAPTARRTAPTLIGDGHLHDIMCGVKRVSDELGLSAHGTLHQAGWPPGILVVKFARRLCKPKVAANLYFHECAMEFSSAQRTS
jgi:hypothetical protein